MKIAYIIKWIITFFYWQKILSNFILQIRESTLNKPRVCICVVYLISSGFLFIKYLLKLYLPSIYFEKCCKANVSGGWSLCTLTPSRPNGFLCRRNGGLKQKRKKCDDKENVIDVFREYLIDGGTWYQTNGRERQSQKVSRVNFCK